MNAGLRASERYRCFFIFLQGGQPCVFGYGDMTVVNGHTKPDTGPFPGRLLTALAVL